MFQAVEAWGTTKDKDSDRAFCPWMEINWDLLSVMLTLSLCM